jgi:hypothetical protein
VTVEELQHQVSHLPDENLQKHVLLESIAKARDNYKERLKTFVQAVEALE